MKSIRVRQLTMTEIKIPDVSFATFNCLSTYFDIALLSYIIIILFVRMSAKFEQNFNVNTLRIYQRLLSISKTLCLP